VSCQVADFNNIGGGGVLSSLISYYACITDLSSVFLTLVDVYIMLYIVKVVLYAVPLCLSLL
jgi:hypothetical protein